MNGRSRNNPGSINIDDFKRRGSVTRREAAVGVGAVPETPSLPDVMPAEPAKSSSDKDAKSVESLSKYDALKRLERQLLVADKETLFKLLMNFASNLSEERLNKLLVEMGGKREGITSNSLDLTVLRDNLT